MLLLVAESVELEWAEPTGPVSVLFTVNTMSPSHFLFQKQTPPAWELPGEAGLRVDNCTLASSPRTLLALAGRLTGSVAVRAELFQLFLFRLLKREKELIDGLT